MSSRQLFHSLFRTGSGSLVLLCLCLLSSCRVVERTVEKHTTVSDTVAVHLRDSTHVVHRFDTVYVTNRETVTEHIVQHYSAEGVITLQTIDRLIQRTADSIAAHRLDSMLHVAFADSIAASHHDDQLYEHETPVTQPWYQRLLCKLSNLIVLALIIAACFVCVKILIKHNK